MKKKFIEFLKENGIYERYKKLLKTYYQGAYTLTSYCKEVYPEQYFNGAFIWSQTEEGEYFWVALDAKWRASL